MPVRVLVVEDDPVIAAGVGAQLGALLDAEVSLCADLSGALELAPSHQVAVLDLRLPDSDGLDSLPRLRAAAPDLLIIVASARDALDDRVAGLRQGADDYLVKPYSPLELAARVEALLRRVRPPAPETDTWGIFWDRAARSVHKDGAPLPLTPLEYEIFAALADRPGKAVSRAELLRQVMGPGFYGYERVVDVHVGHVRRKFDPDAPFRFIATVRAFGYRWDGPLLGGGATEPV